ncbi:hypothetical protein M0R19_04675 [Candidatus Pacearchaeota archaeon]|jgi:hypothetical protein|nr:hypothetical protein [Candidatus Pacearchaeota archaeon]
MSFPGPRERKEPSPPFRDPNLDKGKALASLKSKKKIVKLTKVGKSLKKKVQRQFDARQEIKKYLKENYLKLKIDLDYVNIRDMYSILGAIDDFTKEYPTVASKLSYIGNKRKTPLPEKIAGRVICEHYEISSLFNKSFGIFVNPKFWSDPKMHDRIDYEVEQGWRPMTKNPIRSIITHELGHALYNTLSDNIKKENRSLFLRTAAFGYYKNFAVSTYSLNDEEEFFASNFAYVKGNNIENITDNHMIELFRRDVLGERK